MGNSGNAKLFLALHVLEEFGTEYTEKHLLYVPRRLTVNNDLGKIKTDNVQEKIII